jgi:predicted phage terminase large subunit-like protein
MMIFSPAQFAIALRDLVTFIVRSFFELNPETAYIPPPYLELIASHLMACFRGDCTRLIICIPPRHLKSHSVTIAFVVWLLGMVPSLRIICASYGQDLAEKHARDSRKIIMAPWYKRAFGSILGPRQAVYDFATTAHGFRMATSVGGALTGFGADYIILDDVQKPDEALTEAGRKRVIDWFSNILLSRLNDPQRGRIIVVAQRLHPNDLAGHLLEQGGWTLLRLPALAEQDENIEYETPYGKKVFRRREGEPLHPARVSAATLQFIRNSMPPFEFSAQYQQNPTPIDGYIINPAWFRRFNLATFDPRSCIIYQSWDTANKVGELNDYSVCTTWARDGYIFHVIDVFRQKLIYPDLRAAVIAQAQKYRPTEILIEDGASGTQLIQELDGEGLPIRAIKPGNTNKTMRLRALTPLFASGRVYVPIDAPWANDFIDEHTAFPASKHDDQVDSTSQALEFMRGDADYMGMLARLCDY